MASTPPESDVELSPVSVVVSSASGPSTTAVQRKPLTVRPAGGDVSDGDDDGHVPDKPSSNTALGVPLASQRLSTFRVVALALFWWGFACWGYIILVLLAPMRAAQLDADNKGSVLGLTLLVGALTATLASPALGAMSDRCRSRCGRRKPFLVVGVAASAASAVLLHFSRHLLPFILAFAFVQLWMTVAAAPYNGLVADVVSPQQRGLVSGVIGGCVALGNLGGAALGSRWSELGEARTLLATYVVVGLCTLCTVCCTREPRFTATSSPTPTAGATPSLATTSSGAATAPAAPNAPASSSSSSSSSAPGPAACSRASSPQPRLPGGTPAAAGGGGTPTARSRWLAFLQPFRRHDFRYVFLTRLLIQTGVYTMQEYMLFFAQEAVHLREGMEPEDALATVMVPLLLMACLAPLVAGCISDRLGGRRKPVAYTGGALMVAAALSLAWTREWAKLPALGGLFGAGFGAFNAIDFAIALDVVGEGADAAKDLGLWNLSLAIPMTFAAPMAGLLLDSFSDVVSGSQAYTALFVLAAVYISVGTAGIAKLRTVK